MTIHFPGTGGLLATIALAAVCVAAAAWLYRRVLAVPHGRVLMVLRLLAVGACALLVARPALSVERTRIDGGRIAVVVDASRSMSIRDAMGGAERIDAAKALVAMLAPRVADIAPVEVTVFDAAPRRATLADLVALRATGEGSDLARALRAAVEGTPRPSAVVLVTDGRQTGTESVADVAAQCGVPVHTISIGGTAAAGERRDGAVPSVEVDREAFVNSRVAVRVSLRTAGYEAMPGTVEIRRGETVVARQELTLAAGRTEATLSFLPTEPGVFEYEVRLGALPGEAVLENNSRWFALAVTAERVRVLSYEGTPRWEYRYAKRALTKDAGVAFTGLVRTNADRIYQQGSAEMKAFPAAADLLQPWQVIVLGDVGREDLSAAQCALLRKWVEDGGGLMFVGGKKLLGDGGVRGTDLEPLVPLAMKTAAADADGNFAVEATREGASHPVLAGIASFPPVRSLFLVGPAKPGAQVLALAGGEPLIATQRYGSGRVLLLATDNDWTWCTDQGTGATGADAFERLWGQSMRWLADRSNAASSPEGAARLTTDRDVYAAGAPVRISLHGADAAAVSVSDDEGPVDVPLTEGDALFQPRRGGTHTASAGGLRRTFVVERDAREMDKVVADEDLLRAVAKSSGGHAFDQATARDLPAAILRSARTEKGPQEWSAAESPWFFLVLVALLAADWSVRKWLQLA